MKKLRDLTENFKVSRPVFRLQISDSGGSIDCRRMGGVYNYKPTPVPGDLLSELVCSKYSEQFDLQRGSYRIDRDQIVSSSLSEIRSSIAKFIEKNSEMKSPRQSKLYRWAYRNMPSSGHQEFNDTLIMVYKYLRSFCNNDMRGNNVEHINNGLALLEAIMEKYEQ